MKQVLATFTLAIAAAVAMACAPAGQVEPTRDPERPRLPEAERARLLEWQNQRNATSETLQLRAVWQFECCPCPPEEEPPPTPTSRLITLDGNVLVFDHDAVGANEDSTFFYSGDVMVSTSTLAAELARVEQSETCVDNEVGVELLFEVVLRADNSVDVTVSGVLFELNICPNDEPNGWGSMTYNIPAGTIGTRLFHLANTVEGGDWALATFTIGNFPA